MFKSKSFINIKHHIEKLTVPLDCICRLYLFISVLTSVGPTHVIGKVGNLLHAVHGGFSKNMPIKITDIIAHISILLGVIQPLTNQVATEDW